MTNLDVILKTGSQCSSSIDQVADFRIRYFRDYPYLYAGNHEYEKKYLNDLATNPHATLVIIREGNTIAGIATGTPVNGQSLITSDIPKMLDANANPNEYYYFSETVLAPQYRGHGLGRKLYNLRESYASEKGYKYICLLTVTRTANHPQRPTNYTDPYAFWDKLGYIRKAGAEFNFSWPTLMEDGSIQEKSHPMQLWIKPLTN